MGLRNNVPTPLLRTTLNPWPDETPDFVSHEILKEYIQDTAKKSGVHEVTLYECRVTNIHKQGLKWKVTWTELYRDTKGGEIKEKEEISVSNFSMLYTTTRCVLTA